MKRAAVLLLAVLPCFGQDWNPKLAAQYLDSRQKDWFEWKLTASPGGPCLSCHTGVAAGVRGAFQHDL
jgi:hypothetical protein